MNGLVVLPFILLAIAAVVGWIANVCQIVHALNLPITGMFIFKCVGVIVAPLGVVLGWVGIL